MAGNAGEWTLSIYQGYLGIGQLGIGYTPAFRVARGHATDDLFQLASRSPSLPNDADYGFRCVRAGPPVELEQAVISAHIPQIPPTPAAVDLNRVYTLTHPLPGICCPHRGQHPSGVTV